MTISSKFIDLILTIDMKKTIYSFISHSDLMQNDNIILSWPIMFMMALSDCYTVDTRKLTCLNANTLSMRLI